ncbi:MAG: alpha/beta hydrolase [Patescibacteria group bacterium]
MKKYNLILIHSFPTNSLILGGLTAFLSKFFAVYFIDLPGFVRKVPPLETISVNGFSEYLAKEIQKLKLEKYILGCISFSFCVVCKMKVDESCRAILAITPFINKNSFLMDTTTSLKLFSFTELIKLLNVYDLLWKKSILTNFFKFRNPLILETIFTEMDPKTFVDTANLLFSYNQSAWLDKPTLLITSDNDKRLSTDFTKKMFVKNVKDLLIVQTELDHFPKDISEKYFEKEIKKEALDKILEWLETRY